MPQELETTRLSFMKLTLVLVVALLSTVSSATWWSWGRDAMARLGMEALGFDGGDTCGWTRDDALHCIATYVDVNHDAEISAAEFERAKRLYLPRGARWAARVAHALGYDVTIKDVMNGCDVNKDGRLTLDDWKNGAKTCMPGKSDLCKFKTVCDIAEHMLHQARVPLHTQTRARV